MTNLYAFGLDPLAFYSQGLGRVSTDGVNWTTLSKPMPPKNRLASTATNGTHWVGVGPGVATSTQDPVGSWNSYSLWNGWTTLSKIIHNGSQFYSVGFEKNWSDLTERAVVFTTVSGGDASVWAQQYEHPQPTSGFCDIVSLGASTLLAVGWTEDLAQPLVAVTTNGAEWEPIELGIPTGAAVFSVSYHAATNRIWAAGQGWIATSLWTPGSLSWTVSENLLSNNRPRAITVLANQGSSNVIAAGASTVWYSRNGSDWYSLDAPGYTFTSAAFYQNRWYLGCVSTLNRYTGFTVDTGLASPSLEGYHSGVQATSLLVV